MHVTLGSAFYFFVRADKSVVLSRPCTHALEGTHAHKFWIPMGPNDYGRQQKRHAGVATDDNVPPIIVPSTSKSAAFKNFLVTTV